MAAAGDLAASPAPAPVQRASNHYAAGVAAGMATVLTGHPFDTIKVRLQTQLGSPPGTRRRNALQWCTHLLRTEGVRGLYRGATPSFVGVSVESAVLFGSYSQLKGFFQARDPELKIWSAIVPAAMLSGASVGTILCPSELVKCRLQVHAKGTTAGAQKYEGAVDCMQKTIKAEGLQGMFRGLTTTCLRESIGNACFFITYETSRQYMLTSIGLDPKRASNSAGKSESETSTSKPMWASYAMEAITSIATGGISGMAFWMVVLPIDLAKTRIQTADDLKASRNPLYHLTLIYRDLGVRGLYAGLGPTLTRAFPANAAAIFAWEATARILGS